MRAPAQAQMRFLALATALAVSAAGAAEAETIRVVVKGMAFVPAEITAHVGDTIEWENQDFVSHTATERNRDWDVVIPPGAVGQLLIEKAGDMDYFCRFHPNMKARLKVPAE